MHPPEYNLALASAILESLEAFLQSPEAFWPLSAPARSKGFPFPRMSLGALLLTLDELRAVELEAEPAARSASQAVEREFERISQKWTVAVERKALSESSQRLAVWRAYLQDLEDTRADPADYPQEVRQRVVLTRLLQRARFNPDRGASLAAVDECDAILRGMFIPGAFIWDPPLRPIYPEKEFWFLYGRVRD